MAEKLALNGRIVGILYTMGILAKIKILSGKTKTETLETRDFSGFGPTYACKSVWDVGNFYYFYHR